MSPPSSPTLLSLVVLLLIGLVGAPVPASEGAGIGRAVLGRDRALLQPPPGARIEAYENHGYSLSWHGDLLLVEVDTTPIGTTTPFALPPADPGVERSGVERLAVTLTSGETSRFLAVSRILGWISRNVRYELDRSQLQNPASVLERRSGYCTGVAGLAVAMLGAVGIEAREVSGFVIAEGTTGGYHRWIEVHYPDRGWVFSDPLTSHHFVPATYLRLASEELDPRAPHVGRVVARNQSLAPIDTYPYAPSGVLARRNGGRQRAGALRLTVGRAGEGTVTLEGAGRSHTVALHDGRASFVDLRAGRHRLVVELEDGHRLVREVEIDSSSVRRIDIGRGASEGWYRLATAPSSPSAARKLSSAGGNR